MLLKGCTGEEFDWVDDMNIPVDIHLDEVEPGVWRLTAEDYMPRKGRLWEDTDPMYASTREELVEVVEKKILPIYKNALRKLQGIIDNKNESLYYWDRTFWFKGNHIKVEVKNKKRRQQNV